MQEHNKERSIEGQAILKSILESPWVGKLIDEGTTLESIFDQCAKKLDDYAGIKEPLKYSISSPPGVATATYVAHLSDERVAAGVEREGQRPPPESRATSPLKEIVGFVEDTSSKEYKPGKYMFGIKVGGSWHTTFWKIHYNTASEAQTEGKQVRILYDPTPYKGKPSRTVQSVDPI